MQHPGTITFVDGVTEELLREVDASELPETVRFCGQIPVVRVVCFDHPGARIIREYGPDGTMVRERIEAVSE